MQRKSPEAELRTQVAGHDVDERGVAAVSVVKDDSLKSGPGYAGAKIAQHRHEGCSAHRKRSGKTDVLVTLAIVNWRECKHREIGWQFAQGMTEQ